MRNNIDPIVILLVLVILEGSEQKVDYNHANYVKSVYPEIRTLRKKRDVGENENFQLKVVKLEDWLVKLHSEHNLFLSSGLKVEWYNSNNSRSQKKPKKCVYHTGVIEGLETKSKVVMTLCESFIYGYLDVGSTTYFLEPSDEANGEHIIYTSKPHIVKRSTDLKTPTIPNAFNPSQWIFNLTGDIEIDIEDIESNDNLPEGVENTLWDPDDGEIKENATDTQGTENVWYWGMNLSDTMRDKLHSQKTEDENGYFYETAWTANTIEVQNILSGSMLPTRWLEIAVAVDYTVISFHGRARVEEYVLSLLNIVSAIYQDPSLECNMKLVVTKLLMYENKRYCHKIIKLGNAKKSLENVNAWNRALHGSLSTDEASHDLAIWLTRNDIGGPSGYAPVAGVCNPRRSCALNRDEGLTSAFIIAHETAHILGLSHDGDIKSGNNCSDDALSGSVMAPMVSANFNKFYWSQCSRNEFKNYRKKWLCLLNTPTAPGEISLNATLQASFTMDQQCRMEFGDGYMMCRSFEIIEPCSHLWCGHKNSPLICKTKKGPPLEGTECGFGKWCINGYCENFANKRLDRVPIILHPQDGHWSPWSNWGSCSRTCGNGVQFRARKCDNPPPSFGGRTCKGLNEEWRLCKISNCLGSTLDLRAQQCKRLPKIVTAPSSLLYAFNWLPYESDENDKKCKLNCLNASTKEVYVSNENLADGTRCSYDNEDNICVQGVCHIVGCDGVLHSEMRRDKCGDCGGNNSECADIKKVSKRRLRKESSRISVFPEKSREIKVELIVTSYRTNNTIKALILKNRKKKNYFVLMPDRAVQSKIVEGCKFYYQIINNRYTIWTKGPVQNEMVILIIVPTTEIRLGMKVSYFTEFYIHKNHLVPSKRFIWILGGWGPCSASCNGGKRQRTVACFDTSLNKNVKRTECSLLQKPKLDVEMCNTFSCNFTWVPGKWEPCTTSCGTLGVQHREIYCLPYSFLENNNNSVIHPWRFMVNPKRCGDDKPPSLRACNRQPCFSYWTFGNWTQCSVTCGPGFQTRSSHCLPPGDETFFTCGNAPLPQRRSCLGPYNRFSSPLCRGRRKAVCQNSDYCAFDVLQKYCKITGFKMICCKTCGGFSE